VRRALETYLSLSRSSTRGNLIRCRNFLQVLMPGVILPDTMMKSSLDALRRDEADCADALRRLLSGVTAGDIEYCRHIMDETTGVLRYITGAYAGAGELVAKYGTDIATIDSTHHVTSYAYKLSSILVVDAEGRSRPVLFCLLLDEMAANFAYIFSDFSVTLFDDGDRVEYRVGEFDRNIGELWKPEQPQRNVRRKR
jgi:hypothetical protein